MKPRVSNMENFGLTHFFPEKTGLEILKHRNPCLTRDLPVTTHDFTRETLGLEHETPCLI